MYRGTSVRLSLFLILAVPALEAADQGAQILLDSRCLAGGEPLLDAGQRLLKPVTIKRLEEIIERADVEGTQGVVVESRHEDDHGERRRIGRLENLEAIESGHLNVQKKQIDVVTSESLGRLGAILAVRDDRVSFAAVEHCPQALARKRLVVGDGDPDHFHATLVAAGSSRVDVCRGIATTTRVPRSGSFSTEIDCAGPYNCSSRPRVLASPIPFFFTRSPE